MIDVKKLAEQAGASLHVTTLEGSTTWVASGDALTRFAALVREEALKEAARVCEQWRAGSEQHPHDLRGCRGSPCAHRPCDRG